MIYFSDDPAISDEDDGCHGIVIDKKKKKNSGRKSKWTQEMLNDFIDIVTSSEYYKKKLIFMNTKTQRNGEIYDNILKELKQRCAERNEQVPFTVAQMRSKFKKCVGICKQAALTIKSATGIKRFQEDKGFGQWFNQLYSIVKTRDSCNPEIAIEPSASRNAANEVNDSDMEVQDDASKSSDEERGKDNLFIPVPPSRKKKKVEPVDEALQLIKKAVEKDHTKDLIDFMKDQMQKSQEHELKVLQMILNSESVPPSRNVHPHGIPPVYQQPYMPPNFHWNSGSAFQPILQASPMHARPPSNSSSSSSSSMNLNEPTSELENPTYYSL